MRLTLITFDNNLNFMILEFKILPCFVFLQSLRCKSLVSPLYSPDFHICRFCDPPTKFKFSPNAAKNSEKCVICGQWIPHQASWTIPKLCTQHSKMPPLNSVMCNVCNVPIRGPNGPPLKGHLCFQCGSWRGALNQCCFLG